MHDAVLQQIGSRRAQDQARSHYKVTLSYLCKSYLTTVIESYVKKRLQYTEKCMYTCTSRQNVSTLQRH